MKEKAAQKFDIVVPIIFIAGAVLFFLCLFISGVTPGILLQEEVPLSDRTFWGCFISSCLFTIPALILRGRRKKPS